MDEGSTTVDDIDEIPVPPSQGKKVAFLVVEGKDKGGQFDVLLGNCRALGRPFDEAEKTRLVESEAMIGLDDFSKKLVFSYISKQFGKQESPVMPTGFAGFHRENDFILQDRAISRLHAIIFYDATGVGILDLVSKNGTFVNGIEVESKMLKEGDLISVGKTKIRFEGFRS